MPHDQPSEHTDITPDKARTMLHDNSAQGHPLTDKQKRFLGAIIGKEKVKKHAAMCKYARNRSDAYRT